ncbi:MAG: tetratricopeptide repeat-containing protein [Gammaproteobacteria bacterium]|nr:tetratricopeptide repeat-containing protein [Gammaproteobacteria bacterium]
MCPRPSHLPKSFIAQKKFTDRVEIVDLFHQNLYTPQSPTQYRVLVIYGAGGHGKTRLCREFLNDVADVGKHEKKIAWAHVDFAAPEARSQEQALLYIRLALGERAGLAFPAFNRAFLSYFAKTRPGASAKDHYPELFGGNLPDWAELADLAVNIASGLPVLALLKQASDWGRQWYQARGRSLINEIEEMTAQELYESLPKYLGSDILHYQEHSDSPRRLVVFLDTYEQLWQGRGGLLADKWVRDMAAEMPGVLLVVLGRDRLRWEEIDPSWAEFLDQHLMGELSDEDAYQFLRGIPIAEPDIISRIVTAAKGVPFYLDLEADVYEAIRNKDMTPSVDHFGGNHPQIIERFISHCSPALASALRALAHTRIFDEVLFDALRQAMPGEVHQISFNELKSQSFITCQPDGSCTMHALMHDYLIERTRREDPSFFHRMHEVVAAFWQPRAEVLSLIDVTLAAIRALDEASYHLEQADPEAFAKSDWLDKRFDPFRKAAAYVAIQPILERQLELRERTLGREHPLAATSLHNLARVYSKQRRLSEAESLYRRALDIRERLLGENHPDVASTLSGLASVIVLEHSDFDGAIKMRRRALAICLEANGEFHKNSARYMSLLGSALSARGEFAEAETLIRQALSIRERLLGSEHSDVFRTLGTLALLIAGRYGDYAGEAVIYRRILAHRENSLPPDHPDVQVALNNLGSALVKMGLYDEAEQFYRRLLETSLRYYPPDHPKLALRYSNLGSLLRREGNFDEAEPMLLRSVEIRVHEYGEDHPSTAFSYLNLGLLLLDIGNFDDAAELISKCLKIRELKYGPQNRRTARGRMWLASVLRQQGNLSDAEQHSRRALEDLRLGHTPDHPWIANALVILGDVLRDKNDFSGAKECYSKAVDIFERKFESQHPDLIESQNKLSALPSGYAAS